MLVLLLVSNMQKNVFLWLWSKIQHFSKGTSLFRHPLLQISGTTSTYKSLLRRIRRLSREKRGYLFYLIWVFDCTIFCFLLLKLRFFTSLEKCPKNCSNAFRNLLKKRVFVTLFLNCNRITSGTAMRSFLMDSFSVPVSRKSDINDDAHGKSFSCSEIRQLAFRFFDSSTYF